MIIGREPMVQLCLLSEFKLQVLQWDGVTTPIKEPIGMLGKSDLTSHEMCKVVINTRELVSTIEATERLVKILHSKYAKEDLKEVSDNAIHMKSEEITQLLRLLEYFEEFLMVLYDTGTQSLYT